MSESFVVRCGFCKKLNRVLFARMEQAKCGACKAPLAEAIADLILEAAKAQRDVDLRGFIHDAQDTANALEARAAGKPRSGGAAS